MNKQTQIKCLQRVPCGCTKGNTLYLAIPYRTLFWRTWLKSVRIKSVRIKSVHIKFDYNFRVILQYIKISNLASTICNSTMCTRNTRLSNWTLYRTLKEMWQHLISFENTLTFSPSIWHPSTPPLFNYTSSGLVAPIPNTNQIVPIRKLSLLSDASLRYDTLIHTDLKHHPISPKIWRFLSVHWIAQHNGGCWLNYPFCTWIRTWVLPRLYLH